MCTETGFSALNRYMGQSQCGQFPSALMAAPTPAHKETPLLNWPWAFFSAHSSASASAHKQTPLYVLVRERERDGERERERGGGGRESPLIRIPRNGLSEFQVESQSRLNDDELSSADMHSPSRVVFVLHESLWTSAKTTLAFRPLSE